MLVTIASLFAFLAGILGFIWFRGRRSSGDLLPDAGISTLVFPPESKFRPSVLPRH
jgi:hypothetical protein